MNNVRGVGIFLFDKNYEHLLVIKGKSSRKWGPPKGYIDLKKDKSFKDVALRELEEETSIKFNLSSSSKYIKIAEYLLFIERYPQDIKNLGNIKYSSDEIIGLKWLSVNEFLYNPNKDHENYLLRVFRNTILKKLKQNNNNNIKLIF